MSGLVSNCGLADPATDCENEVAALPKIPRALTPNHHPFPPSVLEMKERQTERQRERQTERHRERHTERDRDRETQRQTDRETESDLSLIHI